MAFLGLEGMFDPARPEVKVAVETAQKAGLRCIMITGDYKDTAAAMVTEMSDERLDGMVLHLNTSARSSQEHKMGIVDSLRRCSQVVAMTVAILSSYLLPGVHPGASMDNPDLHTWQTVAFATSTLAELLRAFTARSERISVFKLGVFSNKTMNMAVIFSIILVFAVIYVRFLPFIFGTVPLALVDWLWILPFAVMASVAAELTKIYPRARAKKIEANLTAQMELA